MDVGTALSLACFQPEPTGGFIPQIPVGLALSLACFQRGLADAGFKIDDTLSLACFQLSGPVAERLGSLHLLVLLVFNVMAPAKPESHVEYWPTLSLACFQLVR